MTKRPTLQEKLDKLRHQNPDWKARYDTLVQGLIDAKIAEGALKAGDLCPEFALANAEGAILTSNDLLANGPMVLSFYRGKWCPYCMTEIEALQEVAGEIAAAGASLVAVTAEDCGGALKVKRQKNLKFEILCDFENGLGLAFGLVFRVPQTIREEYQKIDINFPLIYGNESWFLPIPATYVIGQNGTIRHAYVNPDFRERMDPQDILRVLDGLNAPVAKPGEAPKIAQ
jgi:peroxiredoxin